MRSFNFLLSQYSVNNPSLGTFAFESNMTGRKNRAL